MRDLKESMRSAIHYASRVTLNREEMREVLGWADSLDKSLESFAQLQKFYEAQEGVLDEVRRLAQEKIEQANAAVALSQEFAFGSERHEVLIKRAYRLNAEGLKLYSILAGITKEEHDTVS